MAGFMQTLIRVGVGLLYSHPSPPTEIHDKRLLKLVLLILVFLFSSIIGFGFTVFWVIV